MLLIVKLRAHDHACAPQQHCPAKRRELIDHLLLLCLGAGLMLLQLAKRRLRDGKLMLAATRAELSRDSAALGARE